MADPNRRIYSMAGNRMSFLFSTRLKPALRLSDNGLAHDVNIVLYDT
jgi:hypothetical protein